MEKDILKIEGEVTQEQIEAWKREYGTIVEGRADDCVAYFKRPSRQQISYAQTLQNDPLKMAETLLKACFVGGSDKIYTDLEHLLGAGSIVDSLITIKTIEVKKL